MSTRAPEQPDQRCSSTSTTLHKGTRGECMMAPRRHYDSTEGGTRTLTTRGRRILNPLRLPFRHFGLLTPLLPGSRGLHHVELSGKRIAALRASIRKAFAQEGLRRKGGNVSRCRGGGRRRPLPSRQALGQSPCFYFFFAFAANIALRRVLRQSHQGSRTRSAARGTDGLPRLGAAGERVDAACYVMFTLALDGWGVTGVPKRGH